MTFATIDCTSTAQCVPNTYGWNSAAFTAIVTPMQNIFPRLQATNVTISYARPAELNNLGFNEPNGFPISVTVKITGMTHQFYFIGGLVCIFGGLINSTPPIPEYKTTLIGEDMCSDGTICGF